MLSLVIYIETQGHFLVLERKYENPSTLQAANQVLTCPRHSAPREDTGSLGGLTLAESMMLSKSLTSHPPWERVRVEAEPFVTQFLLLRCTRPWQDVGALPRGLLSKSEARPLSLRLTLPQH